MSHRYHPDPGRPEDTHGDPIVFDDCPDCDRRASLGAAGLLHYDGETLGRLADRVVAVEYRDEGRYATRNERELGRTLYHLSVLLERHPEIVVRLRRR